MTNYGKNRYLKIVDIHFINIKEYFIDDKTNLVAYYQNKYQINIKNANQPALVMQDKASRRNNTQPNGPCYVIP